MGRAARQRSSPLLPSALSCRLSQPSYQLWKCPPAPVPWSRLHMCAPAHGLQGCSKFTVVCAAVGGRGQAGASLTGRVPSLPFPLAPSSKARENWGRGAQVLPTDLVLRPQEPENEGLRWGKVDPPPEPAHRSLGMGSSCHLSTRGWCPVGRAGEPSHPSTELGLSSLTQAVG